MNWNRKQPRKRRRIKSFLSFFSFCRKVSGGLVFLFLACFIQAISTNTPEMPKRGGTLRLAAELDYHSLDPALIYTYDEGMLAYLVFNPLLDLDRQGRLIPVLAKKLPEISPDRLTYTFEHLQCWLER